MSPTPHSPLSRTIPGTDLAVGGGEGKRLPGAGCTSGRAAHYVARAMTSSQQRVYELHFMGCQRCLVHVEQARSRLEPQEGRDGHMGSRAWLAAQAANSTEIRWYQRRRLMLARAVIDGATLKSAGEPAGISAERVRQILVQLSFQVLAAPGCPPAPPEMDTSSCATESMRKHADWWRARLDELALSWGIDADRAAVALAICDKEGVKDVAVTP